MKTIEEILQKYRADRESQVLEDISRESYWLWVYLKSAEAKGSDLEEALEEWLLD